MKDHFVKPRIVISKCLGFARCRWNGDVIPDDLVERLKPFVEYITVCPEYEIGLGIPRDPIRVVFQKNALHLMQLNTGRDVTGKMNDFAAAYTGSLKDVDGFILKDRSPSCGIKEVKVYPGLAPSASLKKTSGFFARAVLERFPETAVESETRLTNFAIREHFLTRIFTVARFREMAACGFQMKDLVAFHAENKLLLMAYNQKELKVMGNIVANAKKNAPRQVFKDYRAVLDKALDKKPSAAAAINVLMHGLGYFSKDLKSQEKQFFLNTLEEYRREQAPLSVPVGILHSYAIRYDQAYISQQTFLAPFPRELTGIRDSGKGRQGQ
jgi:uncharacterized protein YbgA (DUF1722 family)/uncharacterized protein YbbK (DUF523 family)